MIDCKTDCRWVERCDAASAFKYHRESCPVYGEKEHRTQTNADRIRAMTDEELEAEFWRIYKELPKYSNSSAWFHEWLKQESECEQWQS